MRCWIWFRRRLNSIFRRDALDTALADEIAYHLDQLAAEFQHEGMSEADAIAAARRAFGPAGSIREACRDERKVRWLEELVQDSRFALRSFALTPTFTFAVVVTLALGVGANTAFFSTAYSILFKALPYRDPDRLVSLEGGVAGVGPVTSLRTISQAADYAGYLAGVGVDLRNGGEPVRVPAASATWNLLRVLGGRPLMGRWFVEGDEQPGHVGAVVLSHSAWRDRFGSDPGVIGRRISLNERPFEIVGVMAPGFAFPTAGAELWLPVRIDPRAVGDMWGGANLFAVGRLHDGVSAEQAQAELAPVVKRIRRMFPWRMPDEWGADAHVLSLNLAATRSVRPKLFALAGGALLLLLIACGNVANLLLARTVRREREFRTREALGAGRARLARQLMTENLLVAAAGCAAGGCAAWLVLRMLPWLLPPDTPRLDEAVLPGPVLYAFAALALLLTMAVFGLAPLLWMARQPRGSGPGRGASHTRNSSRMALALVGGQLALATILMIGAGLMGRTLLRLGGVETGIRTAGIVTARVSAGPSVCRGFDQCLGFFESMAGELAAHAGVRSVNWANLAPLEREISAVSVAIEDHPTAPNAPAFVLWNVASTPGYFRALGIPLLQGRLFTDADRSATEPVAVIGARMARRFWPGQSAIGKRIRPMSDREWRTVVGVVGDVEQYALTGYPSWIDGVEYVPLAQALPRTNAGVQLIALIESSDPSAAASLPQWVRSSHDGVVASRVQTLDAIRSESVTDQRSTAWLLALFAAIGLLLGIAGVHGVVSHRIGQQTREIGIRIALGARVGRIVWTVIRQTGLASAAGLASGIAAAFGLSRFLRSLMFGVTEHDALIFAGCPIVLLLTAVAAATWPAMRAARVDPAVTLREQ